jgi:hypothetical protein
MGHAYAPDMHGTPTHRRFETVPTAVDIEPLRALIDVVPARAFLQPEAESALQRPEQTDTPVEHAPRTAEPTGH